MKALLMEEFRGALEVRQVPDPEPGPADVVVAVRRTGICRSDWHAWQGHDPDVTLPHVLGHELAGEVVAIGRNVQRLSPGDRVTVPFVSGCGTCRLCQQGDPQVCERQFQPGFTHWGSFAELVRLQQAEHNVVKLPESLSFEVAASLGCRFTTAYRALVQLARVRSGETVVVFGCGGVGLSALLIARALGAEVVLVDLDAGKLQLAKELGATSVVAAGSPRVVEEVLELTRGGAHVSMDALGSQQTLEQSVRVLMPRGRQVQVGLLVGEREPPRVPMGIVIAKELSLLGSHGIAAASYPGVFEFLERHQVPLQRLVGARVGLTQVHTELQRMGRFAGLGMTLVDPQMPEETK